MPFPFTSIHTYINSSILTPCLASSGVLQRDKQRQVPALRRPHPELPPQARGAPSHAERLHQPQGVPEGTGGAQVGQEGVGRFGDAETGAAGAWTQEEGEGLEDDY